MAEQTSKQRGQGTFAQLYEVQEELNRRGDSATKPLGRPPKKVQRKPTTIHLTQIEHRNLSKLHLLLNDHVSVNRSELVGIAIDALSLLLEQKDLKNLDRISFSDAEALKKHILDFMKL